MFSKFKNKYRIESTRLKGFDYGSDGSYYLTICTHKMQHFFGKVENKKMHLSPIGKIAEKFWLEIPKHFPFIILDEFQIMPNHIHGILTINKIPAVQTSHCGVSHEDDDLNPVQTSHCDVSHEDDDLNPVQTSHGGVSHENDDEIILENKIFLGIETPQCDVSTKISKHKKMAAIAKTSGTISSVIGSYKSVVTKHAHKIDLLFEWHVRFHDHIIRDGKSFRYIQRYIIENPENWKED